MNKRLYNKVMGMYKTGISSEVCAGMIVEYCRGKDSNCIVGQWLNQFYKDITMKPKDVLACMQQLELYDLTPETALRAMGITSVMQLNSCANCGDLDETCDCREKAGQVITSADLRTAGNK